MINAFPFDLQIWKDVKCIYITHNYIICYKISNQLLLLNRGKRMLMAINYVLVILQFHLMSVVNVHATLCVLLNWYLDNLVKQ